MDNGLMAGAFRALLGYFFLVLVIRIAGRRPGKQMTPMEFILVFFCGGLTLTGVVADDRSLTNALCQIIAVAFGHYLLTWLRQVSPALGRVIDGTPLVLLERGQWRTEALQNTHISQEDVMAMARDNGLETLNEIEYAILERNGEISIIETAKQ
jgi:uncharacterized membrane protein YcaP (DUF421 family)